MLKLAIICSLAALGVFAPGVILTPPAPAAPMPAPQPVARPVEQPKPVLAPPPRPVMPVHIVRLRVTACSPDDPKDKAYYAANGYEGNVYGIAANLKRFPRGTFMRVPGYMQKSFPDQWWEVDSAGGSVIRRSARMGVDHIDVKFNTYYSAVKWGSQWLDVEVVYEDELEEWNEAVAAWDAAYAR